MLNKPSLLGNLLGIGLSPKICANVFGVCLRTIQRWKSTHHHPRTGPRGRIPKLTESHRGWILDTLEKDPFLTQREIAAFLDQEFGIQAHRSTVSRVLKLARWSKKKPIAKSTTAQEDVAKAWLERFRECSGNQKLLSLDETSFVTSKLGPRLGYAPKGDRVYFRRDCSKRKRYTLLACIDEITQRPVHHVIVEGSVNGVIFQGFISNLPDECRGSTLLLDNARIHHAGPSLVKQGLPSIAATAVRKGIGLQYTPPYSPQCNPIELFFASLKRRIGRSWLGVDPVGTLTTAIHSGSWNAKAMFVHCFPWRAVE